tara:strand:+ start:7 stop:741 length:735 start_codon:yes stop_codon:yes gene_type:complete
MINAWSLLYEEYYGTMAKTYPIKENDMSPCKLEDITITSLESDEYDPIITVGSGNTASVDTSSYYVDTTQSGEISIDTSVLDKEHITISGGDATLNFDDFTFIDDRNYESLTLNIPDDSPLSQNFLADNDDAAAHHFTTPPSINKEGCHKYEEDKSIKALQDYVSTTYGGHYTSEKNDVQTLDLIESVGDAEAFCRSNALKYLSRYDKKGQAKRDILKALHYTLLLYYFSGHTNETPTRGYETF